MDAAREKAVLDAAPTGLFIGGTWRESRSGATFGVVDPATEQTLCEVTDGTVPAGLEDKAYLAKSNCPEFAVEIIETKG